jgi:curli biogenesis system outer membrane secretion channel CsgG
MKRRISQAVVVAVAAAVGLAGLVGAAASDKPRIAVLEFKNKAENQWWYNSGAAAAQDVFVTELVKSGKFRVIDREQLAALMEEKNMSLAGDIDAATAIKAGKLLGCQYFLTGAVTEYGATDSSAHGSSVGGLPGFSGGKRSFTAAMNARIIDTTTGEILWADEARGEDSHMRLSIGGFGGGVDNDSKMFDKVMKPVIQQLVASIKAADL